MKELVAPLWRHLEDWEEQLQSTLWVSSRLELAGRKASWGFVVGKALSGERLSFLLTPEEVTEILEWRKGRPLALVLYCIFPPRYRREELHHWNHLEAFLFFPTHWREVFPYALLGHQLTEKYLRPVVLLVEDFPFCRAPSFPEKKPLGTAEDSIETPTKWQKIVWGKTRRRCPEVLSLDNPLSFGLSFPRDFQNRQDLAKIAFGEVSKELLWQEGKAFSLDLPLKFYQPRAPYWIVTMGKAFEQVRQVLEKQGEKQIGVVGITSFFQVEEELSSRFASQKRVLLALPYSFASCFLKREEKKGFGWWTKSVSLGWVLHRGDLSWAEAQALLELVKSGPSFSVLDGTLSGENLPPREEAFLDTLRQEFPGFFSCLFTPREPWGKGLLLSCVPKKWIPKIGAGLELLGEEGTLYPLSQGIFYTPEGGIPYYRQLWDVFLGERLTRSVLEGASEQGVLLVVSPHPPLLSYEEASLAASKKLQLYHFKGDFSKIPPSLFFKTLHWLLKQSSWWKKEQEKRLLRLFKISPLSGEESQKLLKLTSSSLVVEDKFLPHPHHLEKRQGESAPLYQLSSWGSVLEPLRKERRHHLFPTPFDMVGVAPVGLSELRSRRKDTPYPRWLSEKCTGCLVCAVYCPEGAFTVKAPLLTEVLRFVAKESSQRGISQKLMGKVPKLSKELKKIFKEAKEKSCWETIWQEKRGDVWEALKKTVEEGKFSHFPFSVTSRFYWEREETRPGSGALLFLEVSPWKCSGCGLCLTLCEEKALEWGEKELREKKAKLWEVFLSIPETPVELVEESLRGDWPKLCALHLERNFSEAASPPLAREGVKLALRLALLVGEGIGQVSLSKLLKEMQSLLGTLKNRVKEELASLVTPRDTGELSRILEGISQLHLPRKEALEALMKQDGREGVSLEPLAEDVAFVKALEKVSQSWTKGFPRGRSPYLLFWQNSPENYPLEPLSQTVLHWHGPKEEGIEAALGSFETLLSEYCKTIALLRKAKDKGLRKQKLRLGLEDLKGVEREGVPRLLVLSSLSFGISLFSKLYLHREKPITLLILEDFSSSPLSWVRQTKQWIGCVLLGKDLFFAQTAFSNLDHFYQSLQRAFSWEGLSVVRLFAHTPSSLACLVSASKEAVSYGVFPLILFDPQRGEWEIEAKGEEQGLVHWAVRHAAFSDHWGKVEGEKREAEKVVEIEGEKFWISSELDAASKELFSFYQNLGGKKEAVSLREPLEKKREEESLDWEEVVARLKKRLMELTGYQ